MANNIDVIGEEATLIQLITGDYSNTDGVFEDDTVTQICGGRFSSTSSLLVCRLQNVTKLKNAYTNKSIFNEDYNLTKAYLPKWNTDIPQYSMDSCRKLTLLDAGLTPRIQIYAFYNCSQLVTLILRKTSIVNCDISAFNGTKYATNGAGGAYVYVPRALISTYQSATNWATLYAAHSDMFRALEDYTVDGTTTGDFDESKL